MPFHTWPFLLFMLAVLPLYYAVRRTKLVLWFLLAVSYFFYGLNDPWYLLLVVYITAVNYALGLVMATCPFDAPKAPLLKRPGLWLWLGVALDLLPLVFFKYEAFFAAQLSALHLAAIPAGVVFPIGLSFFTFQGLSYLIDLYLGKIERERNLLRFANFVCFFPQVLMGPIERAGHLLPQFENPAPARLRNFTDGCSLILLGLFKKLALAAYLAKFVDRVYDNPAAAAAPELILATVVFGWQIYFDFSGYTDMARGIARLLGFKLVLNFNHPYLATGIGDFWRRWHMSFSRWILDYIFMPLQMLWREWTAWGTALALFITFLFSGVWHGGTWKYVVWGGLHGLGLAATHQMERSKYYRNRVPTWLKRSWTFAYVSFAWIFFHARDMDDALLIVRRIFSAPWTNPHIAGLIVLIILAAWIYQVLHESKTWRPALARSAWAWGTALAVLLAVALCFCASGGGAFIYQQF